jgi:hypothetical protein
LNLDRNGSNYQVNLRPGAGFEDGPDNDFAGIVGIDDENRVPSQIAEHN